MELKGSVSDLKGSIHYIEKFYRVVKGSILECKGSIFCDKLIPSPLFFKVLALLESFMWISFINI